MTFPACRTWWEKEHRCNRLCRDVTSDTAVCHAMGAVDLRDGLAQIHAPTRVLVGEFDPATPPAMARLLADGIDGADLQIVTGASHLSPVERPDVFVSAVSDVVERVHGSPLRPHRRRRGPVCCRVRTGHGLRS